MKAWISIVGVGVLLWGSQVPAERVNDLVAPLPASYVYDPGNHLAADTRAELDRVATVLDDTGKGQLAFVIIETTAGTQARKFATDLMNRWGVGHAEQDDGTLFLIARADRAAEIVLGDGIDNATRRARAQVVMDEQIVPRLRNGDMDQALVAGATSLLQSVYSVDLSQPSEAPAAPPAALLDANTEAQSRPAVVDDVAGAPLPAERVDTKQSQPSTGFMAGFLAVVAAAFAFILWVIWKILSGLWGLVGSPLMPRRCRACRQKMQVLGEVEDDAHLTAGELSEERLKSVNHRVFLCPDCNGVEKLAKRAWFSSYANCPSCQSRAMSRTSRTITAATRYSTGLAEVTETCQHCQHSATSQQSTPCLPPPSSSSSSGGRSYGGGSSSGGGASGRW